MIKKAFSIVLVLAVMLSLCAVVRAEGANTEIDPGKLYIKTPDGKLLEVEKGEEFFLTFYTSGYKPIGIVQGRLDLDGSIFSVIDKEICYPDKVGGEFVTKDSLRLNWIRFDMKAEASDISEFSEFAQERRIYDGYSVNAYTQPIFRLRMSLNADPGVYKIDLTMFLARDIDGTLLYHTDKSFSASSFKYGLSAEKKTGDKWYMKLSDKYIASVMKDEELTVTLFTIGEVESICGYFDYDESVFSLVRSELRSVSESEGGLMGGEITATPGHVEFESKRVKKERKYYEPYNQQYVNSHGISGNFIVLPMVSFTFRPVKDPGTYPAELCMKKVLDYANEIVYSQKSQTWGRSFDYMIVFSKEDDPAEPKALRGDADGSGDVNNRDAMILDRYVAGWNGYRDRIVDMDALDLSGDGAVNNRDAIILDRYVAGWQGYEKYLESGEQPQHPTEPEQPTEPQPTEPTEPAAPTVPRITKVQSNNSGTVITWDAFPGAELYRVFYKTGSNSWKKLGDTASTSFTHTDAPYNTECRYTVRCVDKNGSFTSDFDKDGYLNTRLKNPIVKSAKLMEYFIGLSWDKVEGAKAYRVYIKGGEFKSWTHAYDSDINYVDMDTELMGLESNTKYYFTVQCIDNLHGDRTTSGYDTAGVSVKYYATPFIYGIVGTAEGVELYWTEVEGVSSYRVFEWIDDGWKKLGDTEGTAILINGLRNGDKYRFTVRGLDSSGKFITPYDSFGRFIAWYDWYSYKTYKADRIISSIKRAAVEAGFCDDENAPLDADETHYFFLDSTAFYDGADLDGSIGRKSNAIVERLVERIKRGGEPVSNYCFDIEVEADENDELWFYFVYTRRADVE